jgi:hypothetical protein
MEHFKWRIILATTGVKLFCGFSLNVILPPLGFRPRFCEVGCDCDCDCEVDVDVDVDVDMGCDCEVEVEVGCDCEVEVEVGCDCDVGCDVDVDVGCDCDCEVDVGCGCEAVINVISSIETWTLFSVGAVTKTSPLSRHTLFLRPRFFVVSSLKFPAAIL